MGTRTASHRYNGAGFVHKGLHTSATIIGPHGVECNTLQLQVEAQDSLPNTTEDNTAASPPSTKIEYEDKPRGPPVGGNDGLQSSNLGKDESENTKHGLHMP